MKLCFLAGANSIHSKRWIEYFARKGHQIHWLSLTPNSFGEIKNVKFYLLKGFSKKPLEILFNTIPVRRLIKKIKPDILHAHYAGVNGILGALSGFHPFVLTAWGSDILIASKSRIVRPLIKFALNKADLITCDAEHMREAMMKLGVPASKIRIINFGIDTQRFSPGPKNKELKERLGISEKKIIISLRSLYPIYDIETIIKAAPFVLKEYPKTIFIIAGEGFQENELKNLAKELNVSGSIKFVGFIPNEELPDYLRTADVYVSTSLSDAGIAASTAEAMTCGLPVVITDTGENRKWVKNGENGFIIPIKNPEILAEKIIYLLKNEDISKKFGERNRKIIEERNDYCKEMAKMEEIYYSLLKNKKYE